MRQRGWINSESSAHIVAIQRKLYLWELRIQILMTKNKTWTYASGQKSTTQEAKSLIAWKEKDESATVNLYLTIAKKHSNRLEIAQEPSRSGIDIRVKKS